MAWRGPGELGRCVERIGRLRRAAGRLERLAARTARELEALREELVPTVGDGAPGARVAAELAAHVRGVEIALRAAREGLSELALDDLGVSGPLGPAERRWLRRLEMALAVRTWGAAGRGGP